MANHATNPAMPTPKAVPWTPEPTAPQHMPHPAPIAGQPAQVQGQGQSQVQAQAQHAQTYAPQHPAPVQQQPQVQPQPQPQPFQPQQTAPQHAYAAPPQQMMPPMPPQPAQMVAHPQAGLMGQAGGYPNQVMPHHNMGESVQPMSAQPAPAQPMAEAKAHPKAKTSLLSKFQKPKAQPQAQDQTQAEAQAAPQAQPAAAKPQSESLINASFLKGLAAGVIIAFAGSTLLGKLGGQAEPAARVATAPAPQPAAPAQTVAPVTAEGATFIDDAVGSQP